jgi:hypothetical protein
MYSSEARVSLNLESLVDGNSQWRWEKKIDDHHLGSRLLGVIPTPSYKLGGSEFDQMVHMTFKKKDMALWLHVYLIGGTLKETTTGHNVCLLRRSS